MSGDRWTARSDASTVATDSGRANRGLSWRTEAEGASTEALAAGFEWLKEREQFEKRFMKAKSAGVLFDEPELAVRLAWDLLMSRESAKAATPAMSPPRAEPTATVSPDGSSAQ